MKCKNCGKEIFENDSFCTGCGTPVDKSNIGVEQVVSKSQPSVVPTPQPVAQPQPSVVPQPQPVAQPQPSVVPQPQPVTQPQPSVVPQPQPIAQPQPSVVSQPQPIAQPQPSVVPQPQPIAQPQPSVVPQPQPMAAPRPAVAPQPNQNMYSGYQPKQSGGNGGFIVGLIALIAVIAAVVVILVVKPFEKALPTIDYKGYAYEIPKDYTATIENGILLYESSDGNKKVNITYNDVDFLEEVGDDLYSLKQAIEQQNIKVYNQKFENYSGIKFIMNEIEFDGQKGIDAYTTNIEICVANRNMDYDYDTFKAFAKVVKNKKVAKGDSNNTINNTPTTPQPTTTPTPTPSQTPAQANTVDYGKYTYTIPSGFEYEIDEDGLVVGNATILYNIGYAADNYNEFKNDLSILKNVLESEGAVITSSNIKTVNGIEFIVYDASLKGAKLLVTMNKDPNNSSYVYMATIVDQTQVYTDAQISTLAAIIKSAKASNSRTASDNKTVETGLKSILDNEN